MGSRQNVVDIEKQSSNTFKPIKSSPILKSTPHPIHVFPDLDYGKRPQAYVPLTYNTRQEATGLGPFGLYHKARGHMSRFL